MAMLEVRDLQVYYGMIHAIKGISFDVNQGEVIALIGAMVQERRQLCIRSQDCLHQSQDRFYLKEKISRKYLLIRSYPWEWHMSLKEDVFSRS